MIPIPTALLRSRTINFCAFLFCFISLAFAYFFLEKRLQLEPCPLCIIDRGIFILMGLLFLIAALHNPARLGQRIYAGINLVLVILGMIVGARHVWLQHYPPQGGCAAGLDYMLQHFPLSEVIRRVFAGSPDCSEVQWRFLGLSIPEQTLLVFLAFAVAILFQLFRKTD